jgi:hypothetical protein
MMGESLSNADVTREFPSQGDQTIRKSMKEVATYHRGSDDFGADQWVRKDDDKSEESVRSRHELTSENVCLYESMQAAQCRLNDLGIRRLDLPTGQIQKALSFHIEKKKMASENLKKEKLKIKQMQKTKPRKSGVSLDGECRPV